MAKRFQAFEISCKWCGVRARSSRPDTLTCSSRCRQRWHAFVREFGYPPRKLPGNVTAGMAIDIEIMRLIRAERARLEQRGELVK